MGRLVRFPAERRMLDRARDTPGNRVSGGVCVRLRPSDAPEGFTAVFASSALTEPQKAAYEVIDGHVHVTWSAIEGGT